MSADKLKEYYEDSVPRFWDPRLGIRGRDVEVYALMKGFSGTLLEYGCGSESLLLALAMEDRFTECTRVDISERALSSVRQAWRNFKHANKDKKFNVSIE